MEITWYGHSCFRLTERNYATVVTDPFDHKVIGYDALRLKSDIVTVSHDAPGHNNTDAVKGMSHVFDYDGITVAHLGDLKQTLTQSEIESLGTVNVILVPVGGGGGLNAAKAAEVISMIEPNLVIPMHYSTPATKVSLDSLNKFIKEMGLSKADTQPSLKVTRSGLPNETHVIVLDYQQS